jgi:hypothetical protein
MFLRFIGFLFERKVSKSVWNMYNNKAKKRECGNNFLENESSNAKKMKKIYVVSEILCNFANK